jgi:plasmid stability protein
MPTLVIRDLSPETHRILQERARQHRRSVNKEVISILEDSVARSRQTLPTLTTGAFPVTQEWLDKARRAGRE